MKNFFIIFLCIPLFWELSFGQDNFKKFSMGLNGGGVTYLGDIDEQHLAPYTSFSSDVWFSEAFALGMLVYAGHLQAEDPPQYFESRVYGAAARIKIAPLGRGIVSPYLTGGIEGYTFDPKDSGGNRLPNNMGDAYPRIRIGYPVGGGIGIYLKESLSLDIESLYHFSYTDFLDDLASGEEDDGFLSVSIGLTLHLGGSKDTDGDGIPDKLDADPLGPEDFDGFMDQDGLPDLDNDQDGIPDTQDKAPMESEDFDGYMDEDGVPDPDNDGDGIPDIRDQAPLAAEDKDGYMDEDGVPDLDNDGDGIADDQDQCPNQAETFNGFQDSDGCPDTKTEPIIEKGESIVLKGIHFQTGSAGLTPDSRTVLEEVVKTLRDNPKIEVEIRGYTDNTGDLKENYFLSEKRAESVKNYLVQNGVDEGRIRTRGFGPEDPIAPNTTKEGREKNRRIEFYRIR